MNELKISDIIVDMGFNLRTNLDKGVIQDYKDNLESLPPVVVFDTPRGLILADGFHRLSAAKQSEQEMISADIQKGSVQDALSFACLANLKHGLPLTRDEKQKAIKDYIKMKAKWSNVKIAEDVGCSDQTIGRYRRQLEADGEIEPQVAREGQDGKMRETTNLDNVEVEMLDETVEDTPDPYDDWFNSRVIVGDTFEVLPTINRKFDLIIADPPYGIIDEDWDKIDVINFTRRWLNLALQKLKSTGRIYMFFSREYMLELKPLIDEIKYEYPLHFGGVIVWNYRNTASMHDNTKTYKMTWEPIFYFYGLEANELHRPSDTYGEDKSEIVGDAQTDVWVEAIPQSNFNKDKRIHPTQKPLAVYKRIIETGSTPGDIVLDPFAGSGTTGHAAHELGRDFILIENNVEYAENIRGRLSEVWSESKRDK